MLISLIVIELCPGQSSKCSNAQRAITPKLGIIVMVFCIAFLPNELCLPTKFHVDISYSSREMSLTKFKVPSMWQFHFNLLNYLLMQLFHNLPMLLQNVLLDHLPSPTMHLNKVVFK
jgi:hypothetical protein